MELNTTRIFYLGEVLSRGLFFGYGHTGQEDDVLSSRRMVLHGMIRGYQIGYSRNNAH